MLFGLQRAIANVNNILCFKFPSLYLPLPNDFRVLEGSWGTTACGSTSRLRVATQRDGRSARPSPAPRTRIPCVVALKLSLFHRLSTHRASSAPLFFFANDSLTNIRLASAEEFGIDRVEVCLLLNCPMNTLCRV